MTERNNRYMEWELLHSLEDLESSTFREHWYYRLSMLKLHIDYKVNPSGEKICNHILERAQEFERGRNRYEDI